MNDINRADNVTHAGAGVMGCVGFQIPGEGLRAKGLDLSNPPN